MSFEIGDQLGGYKLLSRCGVGAYGEVFRARNVVTGRCFALKVCPEASSRSERELAGIIRYQTASAHSELLQIYHAGTEAGHLYYVMDLADDLEPDGENYVPDTLQNRLDRTGRIPQKELHRIALELAESLTRLHEKGLLHRDIKPSNIIFLNGRATLGDIGLVTADNSGSLAGTSGFLSPEAAAGLRPFAKADDFFALGRTIYCALTGNPPGQYPAFPADLDLKAAAEVVALYNFWCSGSGGLPRLKTRRFRKKPLIWAALAAAVLAGLTAGLLWRNRAPIPAPAKKIPTIAECKQQLEAMEKAYPLPENFLRLLPAMRERQKLRFEEKSQLGQAASTAPVTEEEISAMAARPGKADYAEDYVRSERQDAARAAFDAAHRNDPEVIFFKLDDEAGCEANRIRVLLDNPHMRDFDFSGDLQKLRELFRQRQEVAQKIASAR